MITQLFSTPQNFGQRVSDPLRYSAVQLTERWAKRVQDNGGSVSTLTKNAVQSFLGTVGALGVLDKLLRLNLFCGDNLAACLTPIINTYGFAIEENYGFTEGDYTESGGLANTGTHYLRTGFVFTKSGAIGGVTHSFQTGSANNRNIYGATASGGRSIRCERPPSSAVARFSSGDSTLTLDASPYTGVMHQRRRSAADFKVFRNGVEVGSNTTPNTVEFPNVPVALYTLNAGGSHGLTILATLGGYAFDDGTIPDADQPTWYTAWQTFKTAIGRA